MPSAIPNVIDKIFIVASRLGVSCSASERSVSIVVPIVPPMTHRGFASGTSGGNILRVAVAGAADAAHRCQALLKGCEPTVRTAIARGTAVIGAPWIVLRLGLRRTESRHHGANTNRCEPNLHCGPPGQYRLGC